MYLLVHFLDCECQNDVAAVAVAAEPAVAVVSLVAASTAGLYSTHLEQKTVKKAASLHSYLPMRCFKHRYTLDDDYVDSQAAVTLKSTLRSRCCCSCSEAYDITITLILKATEK